MADKSSERGGFLGAIGQFAFIIAIVLLTKTVAAEAYYVPSGSMLPSLLIGDRLLVPNFPYGSSPYSLPVPPRPAGRPRADAGRAALAQRHDGAAPTRRGRTDGDRERRPDRTAFRRDADRPRASDLQAALGRRVRQHARVRGRRGPDLRAGRQSRRLGRQPRPA